MAKSNAGIMGIVHLQLLDELGNSKLEVIKHNLITDIGDEYYAKMGCVGLDGNSAPTLAYGMQLGTGTVDPGKNTTGHLLGTLVSGSSAAFSDVAVTAASPGFKIRYTCSWAAGTATNAAITEAVVTTATDGTTSEATETLARVEFTAVNKGANDTLVINWDHVFYDNPT